MNRKMVGDAFYAVGIAGMVHYFGEPGFGMLWGVFNAALGIYLRRGGKRDLYLMGTGRDNEGR